MSEKFVYPPLSQVTRLSVTTKEAAFYLNLSQQTLWLWACKETGALRPIHIGRRLGWLVEDLISLTGGDGQRSKRLGHSND